MYFDVLAECPCYMEGVSKQTGDLIDGAYNP